MPEAEHGADIGYIPVTSARQSLIAATNGELAVKFAQLPARDRGATGLQDLQNSQNIN
jgi:hypothetical protein